MKFRIERVNPKDIVLENNATLYDPVESAELDGSREHTEGFLVPIICYREGGRLHCLEGNHRLMIEVKKFILGVSPPVEVLVVEPPTNAGKDIRLWREVAQVHVNLRRRTVPRTELRARFESIRNSHGWSQAQIANEFGFDEADVSRILSQTYEKHSKTTAESDRAAREAAKGGLAIAKVFRMYVPRVESGDRQALSELWMTTYNALVLLKRLGIKLPNPDKPPEVPT